MGDLELRETKRFGRSYGRYNDFRAVIRRRVHHFVNVVGTQAVWQDLYKRVQGTRLPVYEHRITHADRLLIHWDSGPFTLLDVGPHDVTDRFVALSDTEQYQVLADSYPARPVLYPGAEEPLFVDVEGEGRHVYAGEDDPSWVMFLDDEQDDAKFAVLELIEADDTPGKVVWLLGGAGTGKTSVLVNLLADLEHYTGSPAFWKSPRSVADFLHQATDTAVRSRMRPPDQIPPGAVVIVDDPESIAALESLPKQGNAHGWGAVVIGFDPLQFADKHMPRHLEHARQQTGPTEIPLRRCYRQAGGVAELALETSRRVLQRSTFYLNPGKIGQHRADMAPYVDLCLDGIDLVDRLGRVKVYRDAENDDWDREVQRIAARADLWRGGWPALLVIVDDDNGIELPPGWRRQLQNEEVSVRVKNLSKPDLFRGQEFQEVWMLLSPRLRQSVDEGIQGVTGQQWEYLRGLHMAFSRPKDGLVVFERGRGAKKAAPAKRAPSRSSLSAG